MKRKRRGATVLEVLIASTILLLVFATAGGSLSSGLQAWRRSELRADVQGNAMVALHAACGGLRESPSNAVRTFRVDLPEGRRGDALAWRAASRTRLLWVTGEALWTAHLPAGDLPAPVVEALSAGQPPPGVEEPRLIARSLRSFRVDGAAPPLQVQVETFLEGYACTMRSAASPVLEVLSGQ